MLTESAKTTINPRTLTDYELLRFTEEFAEQSFVIILVAAIWWTTIEIAIKKQTDHFPTFFK
jgi:hypothetical protein